MNNMGKIIAGTILIVLGISALIGVSLIKFFIAFILILIGIKIVLGKEHDHFNWEPKKTSESTSNENIISEVSIFSSANKVVKADNFKGGKIVMIFSGGRIDISGVKTSEKNIDLEIVTIFGVAQLVIPKGWRINSEGTSIFGGYDIKSGGEKENKETTLNLKGAAIFGGVKVTN